MTSFVAISDTHNHRLFEILNGYSADVLLIAGDVTLRGTLKELAQFRSFLQEIRFQFREIVWIAGNHELELDAKFGALKYFAFEIAEETKTHYLEDSSVTLDGIRIFGSPYTPEFCGWAFAYERGTKRWLHRPPCDVLMTHGPAYKILDKIPGHRLSNGKLIADEYVGCAELRASIFELTPHPRIVVTGHIHCGYGAEEVEGIRFFNASTCNEQYQPVNKPWTFEI